MINSEVWGACSLCDTLDCSIHVLDAVGFTAEGAKPGSMASEIEFMMLDDSISEIFLNLQLIGLNGVTEADRDEAAEYICDKLYTGGYFYKF